MTGLSKEQRQTQLQSLHYLDMAKPEKF